MGTVTSLDPDLFNRRHPAYAGLEAHWQFVESTYSGGRAWFKNNVFKYGKEGDKEFQDRVKRAYRFNHTREVVNLITKYVFKTEISRSEDAPDPLRKFWKQSTKGGSGIDSLMAQADRNISIFGQPYIVVDSTARVPDGVKLTQQMANDQNARCYAYVVRPQDALDMSFDEHGELNWILLHEVKRDDTNFAQKQRDEYSCYRLWTRQESILYKVRMPNKGESGGSVEVAIKEVGERPFVVKPSGIAAGEGKGKLIVEEMKSVSHGLGVVPVFPLPGSDSDSEYFAPSMIDDIAYLDRAVANYLSNLDAIIQDQTFSTLTIPVQSLENASAADQKNALIELGTSRIFGWDAEGGVGPAYISPDPTQAGVILDVVTKIITEIYHSVGMAGERTKMDNAAGIDNSSGVAKSYDFDRMNTMLKARADRLAMAENKIAKLVMTWHGQTKYDKEPVKYSDDFDTRGLYDEFDVANRLTLLAAPEKLRRHQMTKLIEKLFPNIRKDLFDEIVKELKQWPQSEEVDLTTTKPGGPGLKDQSKPKAENQQGQNNTE